MKTTQHKRNLTDIINICKSDKDFLPDLHKL